MPAVLKLSYQGEMRRVTMENDVSYESVCAAVAKAWPEVKDVTAKYADEEGDLCVFCAASFTDFLAVSTATASEAAGQLVLRLELVDEEPMPSGGNTPIQSDAAVSHNDSMELEAVEAVPSAGRAPIKSNAAMLCNSTNGKQEKFPSFHNGYAAQSSGPLLHVRGWGDWHHRGLHSWGGEHGHPGDHGKGKGTCKGKGLDSSDSEHCYLGHHVKGKGKCKRKGLDISDNEHCHPGHHGKGKGKCKRKGLFSSDSEQCHPGHHGKGKGMGKGLGSSDSEHIGHHGKGKDRCKRKRLNSSDSEHRHPGHHGKGKCKGKGLGSSDFEHRHPGHHVKGKGKGKTKGKGKCKRSCWDAELEMQDSKSKCMRPCEELVVVDKMPQEPPEEADAKEMVLKPKAMGGSDTSEMLEALEALKI